jgi:hypothetical protein
LSQFARFARPPESLALPAPPRDRSQQRPWLLTFAILLVTGCQSEQAGRDHAHAPAQRGGIVVPVGSDHYHAEAVFTEQGELVLYSLGQDEAELIEIEAQDIEAFLRPPSEVASTSLLLRPKPQAGDSEGQASRFSAELPPSLRNQPLIVVVPSIRIEGRRYRFEFQTSQHVMPAKVTDSAERELYLQPGGIYTQADILANGSQTASERFQGFQSAHDHNPKPGDKICPITQTKANPSCAWTVDGQSYEFCCPPCIDEFVKRAKTDPESIRKASAYVK